jgi:hypothetical protein
MDPIVAARAGPGIGDRDGAIAFRDALAQGPDPR